MNKHHAKFHRNVFRGLAAALAMGGFSLSTSAADARFDAFMGKVVGNNTTVTFGTGGTPIATSSAGLGTPTIGNMAAVKSGKAVDIVGNVKAPLGNTAKTVGAIARAPITRAAFVRGVGAVVGGPAGLALGLAAPLVIDWLAKGKVTVNGDPTDPDHPFMVQKVDTGWTCNVAVNYPPPPGLPAIGSSSNVGCGVNPAGTVTLSFVATGTSGGTCKVGNSCSPSVVYKNWATTRGDSIGWQPASLDDVVMYMDKPEAPELTPAIVEQAVVKAGIDPFGAQSPSVTVTGPASVPGASTTTSTQVRVMPGTSTEAAPGYTGDTQPGTRTTVTTDKHNVGYSGNVVNYNTTTTTTTTVTNNVTGSSSTTTGQTTTDNDSDAEDKPDLCQLHPDILACAKVEADTPTGDIPKTSKTITYLEENAFGGGSCPADVYVNVNGQSVRAFDWGQSCSYIATYLRPLILLFGAITALFILIPRQET